MQARVHPLDPEIARGAALWRRADVQLAALAGTVSLVTLYYFLLTRVGSLHMMASATSSRPFFFPLFLLMVSGTSAVFGANFAVLNLLLAQRRRPAVTLGSLGGAAVGALGAGCPACGALLLSLMGVGSGLSVLPLAGLELWAGAAAVMGATLWQSLRRLRAADCPADSAACGVLPRLSAPHRGVLILLSVAAVAVFTFLYAGTG